MTCWRDDTCIVDMTDMTSDPPAYSDTRRSTAPVLSMRLAEGAAAAMACIPRFVYISSFVGKKKKKKHTSAELVSDFEWCVEDSVLWIEPATDCVDVDLEVALASYPWGNSGLLGRLATAAMLAFLAAAEPAPTMGGGRGRDLVSGGGKETAAGATATATGVGSESPSVRSAWPLLSSSSISSSSSSSSLGNAPCTPIRSNQKPNVQFIQTL